MATLEIWVTQETVHGGEKFNICARITGATAGAVVTVVVGCDGHCWPGTIYVNNLGTGGCISTDAVLPGVPGSITSYILVATATSSAVADVFPSATAIVKVH